MVGNTKTQLEIINHARELSGLPSVATESEQDLTFYEAQRVAILVRVDFSFARKEVNKDDLVDAGDGWYELPDDFINVISPLFDDRLGDNVKFQNSVLRYTSNETDTTKFSVGFTDTLAYGMSVRYCTQRGTVPRAQMNKIEFKELLSQNKKRERMNVRKRTLL